MLSQPVLMNDFVRQWHETGEAASQAMIRVGASGWYVLGKEVRGFEAALAAYQGRRHAIGCANGLDAIEIGLRALGLEPGERVLTTPMSAFATTLAIVRAGGVPVFIDVDPSGLVDLDLAARYLAEDPRTRFFVPVHLYGHALDLDALGALTRRFELKVVEDCAQAIGARSRGRPVGSVGRLSGLSFYPTKNLGALGDAGAVLTDDDALAQACHALRDYGQGRKYEHERIGLNSRLDELHAAILASAQLPRLAAWTARRREIAQQYHARITSERVRPLPAPEGSESVWHLFPVRVAPEQRDAFVDHMKARGIQTAVHYPKLIPDQRALSGTPFVSVGTLREAHALARSELSLPIHPYLQDDEITRVVEAANEFAP